MKLSFCWITLLALAQSMPLFGSDDQFSRASLVGITSLRVVVEDTSSRGAKLGLTKELIQTDVELKLRLAGMQIESTTPEFLYVDVNVARDGSAASIDIELVQPVALARNPSILIPYAITWSAGTLATHPTSAQFIRDGIKDHVDVFLNAWLSVNPKK